MFIIQGQRYVIEQLIPAFKNSLILLKTIINLITNLLGITISTMYQSTNGVGPIDYKL